ncbi:6-carboxytetrahydropterin synthase [Sphingobium sp.]|uniref:6-carboxytetrahydropterin synthase n=1 Tax=Sphingobium sp. TaxID=1912891 RepID=UPI00262319CF|nr:6-carboxytetrahydropterin synthase [Sphingobium sp.]
MIQNGVSGHFSAAHRAPGQDHFHGHTWTVRAWFPDNGEDALDLRAALQRVLASLDHTELSDGLAWGGPLAQFIGSMLPGCAEVEISREAEGIFARWRA